MKCTKIELASISPLAVKRKNPPFSTNRSLPIQVSIWGYNLQRCLAEALTKNIETDALGHAQAEEHELGCGFVRVDSFAFDHGMTAFVDLGDVLGRIFFIVPALSGDAIVVAPVTMRPGTEA